jgi:hypothetical protein
MVDADGIQFRLDLEKTKRANVIARMCEIGNRSAISIGCDKTVTPKPVAGSRSAMFNVGRDVHKISRKLAALKESNIAVLALQERLALLGSESKPWTMTLDQSNRFETDRNDAIRSDRRARM